MAFVWLCGLFLWACVGFCVIFVAFVWLCGLFLWACVGFCVVFVVCLLVFVLFLWCVCWFLCWFSCGSVVVVGGGGFCGVSGFYVFVRLC